MFRMNKCLSETALATARIPVHIIPRTVMPLDTATIRHHNNWEFGLLIVAISGYLRMREMGNVGKDKSVCI